MSPVLTAGWIWRARWPTWSRRTYLRLRPGANEAVYRTAAELASPPVALHSEAFAAEHGGRRLYAGAGPVRY